MHVHYVSRWFASKKSWNQAHEFCAKIGGNLLSITSMKELELLSHKCMSLVGDMCLSHIICIQINKYE